MIPSNELLKLEMALGTPKLTIDVTSKGGLVNYSITLQLVSQMKAVLGIVTPLTSHGVIYERKEIPGNDFRGQ